MNATTLAEFLRTRGISVTDIAAAAQVHPQTVYRFLNGKEVHRTTLAAFEKFVASKSLTPETQKATG